MSHVTPKRTQRPRADQLMKTQEAFSYSLWRNILRKESTFRDFIFHIPNGYKERPINESPRSILPFALALFIYLYFYYFAKGKYFSRFHTLLRFDSHITIQMKTMTSVNPDTTVSIHRPWPINFTTHSVTYYENIPVCINQRYTSLNKILHIILYNSIIAFNNSRGNNNITISLKIDLNNNQRILININRRHDTQKKIIKRLTSTTFTLSNWGQVIIPTTHYSDSPLLRRPIIPTAHCSDNPLFRRKWSRVV